MIRNSQYQALVDQVIREQIDKDKMKIKEMSMQVLDIDNRLDLINIKSQQFYEDYQKEHEQAEQRKIMREEADQIVKMNKEILKKRSSMVQQRFHKVANKEQNKDMKDLKGSNYLSSNDFNKFLDFNID